MDLLSVPTCSLSTPLPQSPSLVRSQSLRWRNQMNMVAIAESSKPNSKRAKLSAQRKQRTALPNYKDASGRVYLFQDFISHPLGIESLLNTRALQSYQSLDSNTYRCTLPKIRMLKFEVSPIMVLRVVPANGHCTVEMVSCKFEGSQVMERQNEYFSAFMRNHITWDFGASEPYLNVDVKLNLTLEVHTKPFTLLPLSAVETPGNIVIQSLVDRLVPLLIQQLREDYNKWVIEQLEASS